MIWDLRYRSGLTTKASQSIDDWSVLCSFPKKCMRQALHTDADPDMEHIKQNLITIRRDWYFLDHLILISYAVFIHAHSGRRY